MESNKEETRKPIKIRVMNCSSEEYWYKDEVGQDFEVFDDGPLDYFDCASPEYKDKIIFKGDCEVVVEYPVKITLTDPNHEQYGTIFDSVEDNTSSYYDVKHSDSISTSYPKSQCKVVEGGPLDQMAEGIKLKHEVMIGIEKTIANSPAPKNLNSRIEVALQELEKECKALNGGDYFIEPKILSASEITRWYWDNIGSAKMIFYKELRPEKNAIEIKHEISLNGNHTGFEDECLVMKNGMRPFVEMLLGNYIRLHEAYEKVLKEKDTLVGVSYFEVIERWKQGKPFIHDGTPKIGEPIYFRNPLHSDEEHEVAKEKFLKEYPLTTEDVFKHYERNHQITNIKDDEFYDFCFEKVPNRTVRFAGFELRKLIIESFFIHSNQLKPNMSNTRAKFKCESVTEQDETKEVKMSAVTSGSEENEKFFKYTPGGTIYLSVVNPDVKFEEGKEYFVDFTEAE